MYTIAICDDEVIFMEELKKQIESHPKFPAGTTIYTYGSGEALLRERKKTFDLVMLDMQMDKLDGCETAELLRRERGYDFVLGFFTGKETPKAKDFKVKPSRYIMKTASDAEKEEDIGALLLEMVDLKKNEYLNCTYFGKETRINVRDIMYISKYKNGSEIIFSKNYFERNATESCKCNKKIVEIYESLPKDKFSFIQNSFLGNLEYISQYKGNNITFEDGTFISLSRTYREAFRKDLAEYHTKYFSSSH